MAQGIRQSTSHAAGLVRQLLAFSRRQILRPADLDLNAVIDGLLPLLRGLIREDIELRWAPTDGLWSVKADPTQVEQVIVNLAINARDAMPRGGMMTFETANVELDAAHARSIPELGPGRYVLLAVSDTGVGMDAAILERAFEPFFTTKDVGEGTGLGLATAYGIVRQSGGHIWADSELGHGTTFKIFLPRADPSAVEAPAPEVRPIQKGRGGRILVVEDEEGLRALVATILRRRGYEAEVAADGPAALTAAKAAPIDLLLTDVVLPGMGGLEISAEVRKIRPEARVLFMSGYTADAIDQRSLLERDAVLLEKPFSADDLVAAIEKALGRLEAT
jgi:CheY-like chemotaxis protein